MKKVYFVILVALFVNCNNTAPKTVEKDSEKETVSTSIDEELHQKAKLFFKSVSSLEKSTASEQKIALGKKLYFDTRLSKDGNISCNSCHQLTTFGVDNLPTSPGDTKELGARNSPTVIHASLHKMQFWDGRAADVEEQAEGPILNPVEHNIPSAEFLEKRLRQVSEYQTLFKEVYPDVKEPITFKNIANAIGAFERELNPASRFDEYLDGNTNALTAQEKQGLETFISTGCITCHSGIALGGQMFQKFGLFGSYEQYNGGKSADKGLFDLTKKESDKHFFKVPGLRNVEKTSPYFHDGAIASLDEAVKIMGKLQLDKDLSDKEIQDIVAFLKTLTADIDPKYKQL